MSAVWASGFLTKAEMLLAKVAPDFVFRQSGSEFPCGWSYLYVLPGGSLGGNFVVENDTRNNAIGCKMTPSYPQSLIKFEIGHATEIVSHILNGKNRFGNEGERIEFLYLDKILGERAKIIWYDGDTNIFVIDAPSLEIARGFEESHPRS